MDGVADRERMKQVLACWRFRGRTGSWVKDGEFLRHRDFLGMLLLEYLLTDYVLQVSHCSWLGVSRGWDFCFSAIPICFI